MTPIDPASIRRILLIKLRAVGDVILSTIVLKNLRTAFPDAQIDFLTERPSRDIVRGNPLLNETLVFDRGETGSLGLVVQVRRRAYDLVIDLFGNPRSALITRLSGARYRVGFRFRGRTYAYNIIVEPRGGFVHNTQFNLDALEAIGVPIVDRELHVQYSNDDEQFVDAFLAENIVAGKIAVGFATGGGWYTKRWALDRFAALADRISEVYGAEIILSWGPGQKDEVMAVQRAMKHRAFVPPPTALPQLAVLLKRCTFVVCNDSGPMHLAAAVGTPVVGIYGPTNPVLQGPYGNRHVTVRREGLECLGCNLTACPIGHPCMNELTVDMVFRAV
ncbi:MAG: glycosyltransferase family 9 protein, partial [Methanomicrobiales archaeon]|nr:glycosyltransferase family 9 protein [Methanomicrobiales archaeon]